MNNAAKICVVSAAVVAAVPAHAQSMQNMPGMHMPPPPPSVHHAPPRHAAKPQPPAPIAAPTAPQPAAPVATPSQPDMADMPGMSEDEIVGDVTRRGAQGAPVLTMEASGTSWQPASSRHDGMMSMRGDWMFMAHALFNGVYDWQEGPRGDEKAFLSGMVMGVARRDFSNGDALNFRAMFSPDPFMGRSGYPLLLAQGETADGVTPLIDRQHPHDLVMELSASYAHRFADSDALFLYAGLPGEPAFGPPAFMHRLSAMDSPEAPISHHWLDSTHITYGVVTGGWVHDNWKIEASRFHGREPDEHRFDIESGDLDSAAMRASWNPTSDLALQVSWADQKSPEQLHADENDQRWSASAIYTREAGALGWWSSTLAFGRKERSDGVSLDAWLFESALHPNENWTWFARAERVETDELAAGPVRTVGRLSAGGIRDWRLAPHALFGVGALFEHTLTPNALDPVYGGDPNGVMGFVRLKID